MSIDTIRVFAVSKLDWVKKQQQKLLQQARETPREYLDRESHYLWGKRYLLEVVERVPNKKRDAKFAYNHIVEPKMLAWLIEASGTRPELASAIHGIMASSSSMQRKSSGIRKLVPWTDLAKILFG